MFVRRAWKDLKRRLNFQVKALRDIGRLFRAPFMSTASAKPAENGSMSNAFLSHIDLCYLMLASSAQRSILELLYPAAGSKVDKESLLFSSLPGHRAMDWLTAFGSPHSSLHDPRGPKAYFSISCVVSDVRPLNVNLTGALIENVLVYLDSEKREGIRTVAPHWIRNDSGMVSHYCFERFCC